MVDFLQNTCRVLEIVVSLQCVFHSIRFKVNISLEYGGTPFFVSFPEFPIEFPCEQDPVEHTYARGHQCLHALTSLNWCRLCKQLMAELVHLLIILPDFAQQLLLPFLDGT